MDPITRPGKSTPYFPNLVPRVLSYPPYAHSVAQVGENPGNEVAYFRASKMCLKLKYKACSLYFRRAYLFVIRAFRRSEKKARGGRWERKGRNEISAGVGSLCARHFVQLPLIISSGSL